MKKVEGMELKHVKCSVSGLTEDGFRMTGINMGFEPIHEDKIYFTSEGNVVREFPEDLLISLDMNNLMQVFGILLEAVSSYLHNIRSSVLTKDLVVMIDSRIDSKYKIRVRVSKLFFREEEKGRYKVSFAFIDKDTEDEVINISLSKRDVQFIIGAIKQISSSYDRDFGTFVSGEWINIESGETTLDENIKIAKIDNSIIMGETWLHGQEIMNLQYTTNELINRLHIENSLIELRTIYRQMTVVNEGDVLYLEIIKKNHLHEDISERKLRVPLTQKILSILYLYVNIDILARIPEDEFVDADIERFGRTEIIEGERVKYHLTMRESILSIGVRDRKKSDDKKMLLIGKTKTGQFTAEEGGEELDNFIHKYENGEKVYVDLLSEFKIDLRDQWTKIVRALSMAYTQEYLEERSRNRVLFFVINQDQSGRYKYQFQIVSDPANKAPAVMIIEKFRLKGGDEEFISRYRQPLFKKYVYQLLSMILVTAKDMDYVKFTEEIKTIELLPFQYKSFNRVTEVKKSKVAEYGIERNADGEVLFGNLSDEKTTEDLGDLDRMSLVISSEFRILNGYWLPFKGEKIVIGQDGYLRDLYSELHIEEDFGVDWATMLYFGSTL